jgi:lipoprotein Spr
VRYHFGGQSRSGMDCSGFVRQVFMETYGIKLPHNSLAMSIQGVPVKKADLKLGDLVFFKHFWVVDHTGIYMGKGYFIHSATSIGVSYSSLDAPYFMDHYAGARRIADITKL